MMNQLERLIQLRVLILVIQLKKLTVTENFNKLTSEHFTTRLEQANVATKADDCLQKLMVRKIKAFNY